ncbi:MAG: hypothetical protein K8S27_08110 [Candidatus Omnitrophica bacterium]|nr:hypothetical protein [Candidatus Omnitrophota bacterium]
MIFLNTKQGNIRTIIFGLLALPMIGYFIWFSMQRHSQFESKAQACAADCTTQGYLAHDFKWSAFSGEQCDCSVPDK